MARIAFIQNVWWTHLGQMSLAGLLQKHGHETKAFLGSAKMISNRIRNFKPDIVAFSLLSGQQDFIAPHIQAIRKLLPKKPHIIVGGPLTTYSPELIDSLPIDSICILDGEDAILELASQIEQGIRPSGIENLWIKIDNGIEHNPYRIQNNLDVLPFLHRDLYRDYPYLTQNPHLNVITSRGCPFSCTFCYNNIQQKMTRHLGSPMRRQSVHRVIEELEWCKQRYHFRFIRFHDDTFNYDKGWLSRFADLYRSRIGIAFICNVYVPLMDAETVSLLKEAGAVLVCFGIESGDEEYRKTVLHKNVSNKKIRSLAADLKRNGLKIQTLNMINLPGESAQQVWRTIRLNQEIKPEASLFNIYQPYPHTELTRYAKEHGFLAHSFTWPNNRYNTQTQLENRDARINDNLHKFAIFLVRFPSTSGVFRRLAHLPRNVLFLLFHRLTYTWLCWRQAQLSSWREVAADAYYGWRYYKM